MGRILVGVDGSEHSNMALRWAMEEGALRGAEVHVVTTWELPTLVDPIAAAMPVIDEEQLAEGAREVQAEALAAVGDHGATKVTSEVAFGDASAVLVELSKTSSLVVVGSRGRGGFVRALLGSVSGHVAHHAVCPVVIVRPEAEASMDADVADGPG